MRTRQLFKCHELFKCHRSVWISVMLTVALSSATRAEKLSHKRIFAPDHLLDVRIELPDADWQAIRRESRSFGATMSGVAEEPFKYYRGNVTIDGLKIDSVGVRRKGLFGSQDSQRPSLKIKFDEFVKQDPAKGFDRLTLNNNKQDDSQVSQLLAYGLFNAAGVHAPRVSFARVTVNGEYLGIYSNVESVRRPFLRQRFGDDSGNLFEGTLTDLYIKAIERMEAKTNKKRNDRTNLRRLATLISTKEAFSVESLEQIVDVDYFFRFWTVESLIGFWDGYASNQNNYFVYRDPKDQKYRFVPWGADSTFTTRNPFNRFGGNNGPSSVYAQAMLTNRLYHTPGMTDRYRATMRLVLEKFWNEKALLAEVDRCEKLLADHLHQRQSGMPRAMNDVREFIRSRRANIERELSDENWPATVPAEPRKPSYTVNVGTVKGTFATTWQTSTPTQAQNANSENDLKVTVDGEAVQFDGLQVFAAPGTAPRAFGRGFGRRGSGTPAATTPDTLPATIVFAGTRADAGPWRLTLTMKREEFKPGEPIEVRGSLTEGNSRFGGGFAAFGAFGGGGRSVTGQITLTKAGLKTGDPIAGEAKLEIVESRGGMFAGRQGGGGLGGGRFQPPAPTPPKPGAAKRAARLKRALVIVRKQDKDKNGRLNAKEWSDTGKEFAKADADSDGNVSLKELMQWLAKTEGEESDAKQ